MKETQYDFFICHASEDKDSFVRPLAIELSNRGYKVWYDEFSLKLGDSLTNGISEGIKSSLYGLVVLSKNFFNKNWTRKEFDAFLNKEVIASNNLILPVWLEVDLQDVYEFSPFLTDKVAIKAEAGNIDKVVEAIFTKVSIYITSVQDIKDRIDYLINCNNDRRQKYYLDVINRVNNIFHYQEEYYNWYTDDNLFKEDDWDQTLVDIKGKELQKDYNIPNGVWLLPEPFDWREIERAKKLLSKWVFRKLNSSECEELYFLLEEILDTDVHYILYGFPHSTIRSKLVYEESIKGIRIIGLNPKKNKIIEADPEKVVSDLYKKYYSKE